MRSIDIKCVHELREKGRRRRRGRACPGGSTARSSGCDGCAPPSSVQACRRPSQELDHEDGPPQELNHGGGPPQELHHGGGPPQELYPNTTSRGAAANQRQGTPVSHHRRPASHPSCSTTAGLPITQSAAPASALLKVVPNSSLC